MEAHTFTIPPFFITTSHHYIIARKGCNILVANRRANTIAFENILERYSTDFVSKDVS